MEKSVTYGLSRLSYALLTEDGTYAAPLSLPGAVKITLSPETFAISFTGLDCIPQDDNLIEYGYKGQFTVAGLTTDFKKSVYGYEGADGDLIEKRTVTSQVCALLFETDGGIPMRQCYYVCRFGKPEIVHETKTETTTVSTFSIPVTMRANASASIRRVNFNTNSDTYKNWFKAVQ